MNYKGLFNYKSDGQMIILVKKVDETINSSTTLQNDDELFFEAKANTTYAGYLVMYYESEATPDWQFALTLPSGATAIKSTGAWSATADQGSGDATVAQLILTATGTRVTQVNYVITIGSTSGTVNLQWAQNTSDAGDTKMLKGSHLILWKSN